LLADEFGANEAAATGDKERGHEGVPERACASRQSVRSVV
jgi:hypothetical protein